MKEVRKAKTPKLKSVGWVNVSSGRYLWRTIYNTQNAAIRARKTAPSLQHDNWIEKEIFIKEE